MALLQRLFQNRRNAKQYNGAYYGQGESSNTSQCRPRLDKNKIRLLIIADSEKGRVPYFDSNAIQRIEDKQLDQQKKLFKSTARLVPGKNSAEDALNQTGSHGSNGVKYQFQKVGSDVKLLEEMMFGAVAMAYKGSTLKVHHIRCPPQLVVTKVFYPQKPKPESVSGEGDSDSAPNSLSSSYADPLGDFPTPRCKVKSSHVMSNPMDVPTVRESFVDSADEDSGLYSLTSSGSFQSLFPSPSNNSANSYNSLHRRWMRCQTTSLQRRWDSQETLNSAETSHIPKKKQIKLAIGILFSTSDGKNEEKDTEEYRMFQNFFFAHMALIEGHVENLRGAVERASFTGRNMVQSIFESLDQFRDAMFDLYMGPRLREPVWLNMMSNISYRYALCEHFVSEFMFLAAKYDNKSTKFFVSTLLSAVLTYHLAWVATVTPGDCTPSKTYMDKHSAKWIDTLAKTHPYNPLWAQLGDLYGAIGNPLRVARTVVVGRKAELVNKFLHVLSYFIRCSDVHEAPYSNCLSALLESAFWNQGAPPSRGISSEDGSVTPVEAPSSAIYGSSHCVDASESLTCRSCASGTNVKQCDSTQLRKVGSLNPERTLTPELPSLKRDSGFCRDCGDERTWGGDGVDSQGCDGGDVCRRDTVCSTCRHQQNHSNILTVITDASCARCAGNGLGEDSGIENSGSYDKQGSSMGQSAEECRMSAVNIVEDSSSENMKLVRRSAEKSVAEDCGLVHHSPGQMTDSKRPMSLLARQLAADSQASVAMETQKAKMREVQKQFLSGGSSSMFEEYFDGSAETKTIDEVCEHQRVVKHPLVSSGTTSPSISGRGGGEDGVGAASGVQPKISVSRQNSTDTKPHVSRPTSLNPARCRSVTPTELERRRHLSSTSSIDPDMFDPLVHCQEIPIPGLTSQADHLSIQGYDRNFGRSLLGGYSDHYMSDFVLHGTSDTSFRPKLLHDLQTTLQHSILDEPVAESVCIIADTDNWTVEVANSRLLEMSSSGTMPWTTSHLVASLIESMLDLNRLKMSAEFCIMHLEDRMQEMYFKSLMLAEYIKGVRSPSQQQLTAMLGFDASDLPLLLSIAGTHTPNLALGSEGRMRPPN
ncbi:folliculin-interacting protein 1-like isoform X2 [Littorina saxatilis]|uniref:UDENN FNIP1/2-type domain-containing protein n=1 Tax=Littorina saxatilis TaxID=31220 RepID=A0AAN9BVU1_9CAEN